MVGTFDNNMDPADDRNSNMTIHRVTLTDGSDGGTVYHVVPLAEADPIQGLDGTSDPAKLRHQDARLASLSVGAGFADGGAYAAQDTDVTVPERYRGYEFRLIENAGSWNAANAEAQAWGGELGALLPTRSAED